VFSVRVGCRRGVRCGFLSLSNVFSWSVPASRSSSERPSTFCLQALLAEPGLVTFNRMLGVVQEIVWAFDAPHGCKMSRAQLIKFAYNPQGPHGCPKTVLSVFLSSLHSSWCSRFTTVQQCLNRKWNVEAGAYRGGWVGGVGGAACTLADVVFLYLLNNAQAW
jgi:hypothetical protein